MFLSRSLHSCIARRIEYALPVIEEPIFENRTMGGIVIMAHCNDVPRSQADMFRHENVVPPIAACPIATYNSRPSVACYSSIC